MWSTTEACWDTAEDPEWVVVGFLVAVIVVSSVVAAATGGRLRLLLETPIRWPAVGSPFTV